MKHKSTIVRIVNPIARFASALFPALAARLLERLFLTPMRFRRPAREVQWLACARRSVIAFDRHRDISLFTWGDGPVVLLAHGWSGRGSQMGAFAAPLVRAGYRVVAFDAPGHGSAASRGLTGLPEMADAVEKVAAHVGPVHAVVAHSLGTAATTIALARGVQANRLVYVAPPDNPGDYLGRTARMLGFSEAVTRRAQARMERRFGARFEDARGTDLAAGLEAALLVIHDSDDLEVPLAEGARLADAWPTGGLVTTSGLGHSRILRDPEVVDLAVGVVSLEQPANLERLRAGQHIQAA